jgi:hypothetical protein
MIRLASVVAEDYLPGLEILAASLGGSFLGTAGLMSPLLVERILYTTRVCVKLFSFVSEHLGLPPDRREP